LSLFRPDSSVFSLKKYSCLEVAYRREAANGSQSTWAIMAGPGRKRKTESASSSIGRKTRKMVI
jgi:hypothetical protein